MDKKRSQIWGNHLSNPPDEQNVLFCAGRDVQEIPMADQILLPFDIWTNRAHCIMLQAENYFSKLSEKNSNWSQKTGTSC